VSRGEASRRGGAKANLARAGRATRARTRDLGGGVRDGRAVRGRESGGGARGETVASIERANVVEASVEASVEAFERFSPNTTQGRAKGVATGQDSSVLTGSCSFQTRV
jgi:hypothetical protein